MAPSQRSYSASQVVTLRADIAGLFECLPEDKSSVSAAEVNSASTKSRAQLIFHHHSLIVAE